MRKSAINQLIKTFLTAFSHLHLQVPSLEVEKLALLVHSAMDRGRRNFHTSRHVIEVSESLSPLQILAVLFHDLIYFQVDDGFPGQVSELLTAFVSISSRQVFIKSEVVPNKAWELCLDIFAFKPGQKLSLFAGLNELLSAFVALSKLANYLSWPDMATIACCIEATIPFRGVDIYGNSPFINLAKRLRQINGKYELALTEVDIHQIVKLAVHVANKDVENFAEADPGRFLENTWSLLPETNAILWSSLYSIANYREALLKMENFLGLLNPANVFHEYGDVPGKRQYLQLTRQATRNVMISREYLGIKLLTIAIVEALALATGGDAPISMFLGDVKKDGEEIERAEDHLPPAHLVKGLRYNSTLLGLLELGRANDSGFDMKNSPLSAFIYKTLGGDRSHSYLNLARQMFAGQISAREFLDKIDHKIVSAIARSCAVIALSRRERLQRYF